MLKNQHLIDGNWAEEMAVKYLEQQGCAILFRNWRFKRAEVDVICLRNNRLVFVEVKYRKENSFGEPESAVTVAKQNKLQEAAEGFLSNSDEYDEVIFDIISIVGPKTNATLTHFEDAFFPDNLA